jgi:MOSC domain-containing protein YiiM
MTDQPVGKIVAIAVRTAKEGMMQELPKATARAGGGIDGDLPSRSHRGITLISAADWRQTVEELNATLPWHTRRANVLVEGLTMADLIGHTVRFGQITLQVGAETRPCELMDRLHAGLWNALKPNCRAGVYGKVLTGGEFAVGDSVEVVA